ncbi:MAG: hypothetical protein F2723_05355, partial [Actinobacteria bacterium]|nr:hypothetical protein [Actinomycetota bacterium]
MCSLRSPVCGLVSQPAPALAGYPAALLSGALSGTQAVEVARGAIVAPNTETQLLNLSKHATVRDLRDASSRVVAAATDEAERRRRVHRSRYLKAWTDLDG